MSCPPTSLRLLTDDADADDADTDDAQTNYMPSMEPVPQCPLQLLPSEEWEREVLSTFVELRQARCTVLYCSGVAAPYAVIVFGDVAHDDVRVVATQALTHSISQVTTN